MSLLLNLPEDVFRHILNAWLISNEWMRLDAAFLPHKDHRAVLSAFVGTVCQAPVYFGTHTEISFPWLESRRIRPSSLSICGSDRSYSVVLTEVKSLYSSTSHVPEMIVDLPLTLTKLSRLTITDDSKYNVQLLMLSESITHLWLDIAPSPEVHDILRSYCHLTHFTWHGFASASMDTTVGRLIMNNPNLEDLDVYLTSHDCLRSLSSCSNVTSVSLHLRDLPSIPVSLLLDAAKANGGLDYIQVQYVQDFYSGCQYWFAWVGVSKELDIRAAHMLDDDDWIELWQLLCPGLKTLDVYGVTVPWSRLVRMFELFRDSLEEVRVGLKWEDEQGRKWIDLLRAATPPTGSSSTVPFVLSGQGRYR